MFNNSVLTDVCTLEAGTRMPWPGVLVGGFFAASAGAVVGAAVGVEEVAGGFGVGVEVEVEVEVDMLCECE